MWNRKIKLIHWRLAPALLTAVLVICPAAKGERLPLKSYSTSDGLAHNVINKIVRDSRGFLWFCTGGGLSRFDGYAFTNYGTQQGLPHPSVNDLLETRDGFWIATGGGLVSFNPTAKPVSRVVNANEVVGAPPMFVVYWPDNADRLARYVTSLLQTKDGSIWCGTLKGLYRLGTTGGRATLQPVEVGIHDGYGEQRYVNDLVEDRFGSLWIATPYGLYRRWVDGTTARYTSRDGLPGSFVHDLLIDHLGQLWVGTREAGFFVLTFDQTHAPPSVGINIKPRDFEQSEWINQLFETSDHKLWAATPLGLVEFIPEGNVEGRRYRLYTQKNGLTDHNISALSEDTGGNLWLGTANGNGVMRLATHGFISYGETDGIESVNAIFSDRAGGVCFRGFVLGDKHASIFDGGRVDPMSDPSIWPRFGRFDGQRLSWFMPHALNALGWVNEGVTLQARSGEWWIANLFRFQAVDDFSQLRTARARQYFGKDSLLNLRQVWRLFEDSGGRIWISIISATGNGLLRWDPDSKSLRDLSTMPNLPSLREDLVRSFAEDQSGNIWIGFNTGLARLRGDQLSFFRTNDGVPDGSIQVIHTDRNGRLWIASSRGGLGFVEDPNAERPLFKTYTTAEGLSSNSIDVITEDSRGHIYIGTGRGLDELDPTSGRVRHFTTADGLVTGTFLAAFRDSTGALWFGTSKGMSRFIPTLDDKPTPPPTILITGLRVAGSEHNVSAFGETQIILPALRANQNEVQIDFVGLNFTPGNVLRYQYKLDDDDWSPPTEQRVVNFANLSPHRYRILVRAVNSDGTVSAEPAVLAFTILPPFWLRWWFLALAAFALLLVAYVLYRYRVTRLLELANMRTRIATDLHDDIGANLTRISILSEVAKWQFGNGDEDSRNPLTSIADIARESVGSMSDIVWAIDPKRDHLTDLVRRMRRQAEELCSARDINLSFQAPGEEQDLRLGVNLRRDLFLIFKEAINNAARHSHCGKITIAFHVDGSWLTLSIIDNGVGFELLRNGEGHGLENMRERAKELKGEFSIRAAPNEGTAILLRVPHARSRQAIVEKRVQHPT